MAQSPYIASLSFGYSPLVSSVSGFTNPVITQIASLTMSVCRDTLPIRSKPLSLNYVRP